MEPGAPQLHEAFPNNILKHTTASAGNYAEAIKRTGPDQSRGLVRNAYRTALPH